MWTLNKRVFRNFKSNFTRWFPMLILVAICMYIVVSLLGSAEIVIDNIEKNNINNHIEDGEFSTFAKLTEHEIALIENLGFEIEENFYIEFSIPDQSTLRIFKNRQHINLINVDEGNLAQNENEILLEKNYAKANKFKVGDEITFSNKTFKICGIGSTPDYDTVLQNTSDTTPDAKKFGTAFVTDEAYENLTKTGLKSRTEVYLYTYYAKNDSVNSDELKDFICNIDFDASQITDKYFLEMINSIQADKIELENAVNSLSEYSVELKTTAGDFQKGADQIYSTIQDFNNGINELVNVISELKNGVTLISEQSSTLMNGAKQTFNYFLSAAEAELKQNNIETEDLTINNYKNVLNSIDISALSEEAQTIVNDLLSNLQSVDNFYSGVLNYTQGVNEVSSQAPTFSQNLSQLSLNSQQLLSSISQTKQESTNIEVIEVLNNISADLNSISQGLSATSIATDSLVSSLQLINSKNTDLSTGASQIFNSLLVVASEQLSEYGLSVNLTKENYQSQLKNLNSSLSSNIESMALQEIAKLTNSLENYEEFYNGLNQYIESISTLESGITEINTSCNNVTNLSSELLQKSLDFCGYAYDLSDASTQLHNAVQELQSNVDIIDDYFDIDIDNLTMFMKNTDNSRIGGSVDNVNTNKVEGLICGVLIIILLAYILSVFTIHEIDEESSVIGALYSMGVKRRELLVHYIILPVLITLFGGIIGTIVGYSKFGVDIQLSQIKDYFSVPEFSDVYKPYILVYGLLVPPIIAMIVTSLVIYKRLSKSPLSLLRKENKRINIKKINLGKLKFINRFRLRQILSELRTSFAVFVGMFLPVVLVILAVDCFVCVDIMQKQNKEDVNFNYMYTIKYQPKEVPENSEACYVETLTSEFMGKKLDVSVMGIDNENPYFKFKLNGEKNTVAVGSGTALKFGLKVGDQITLLNSENNRYYTFEISEVVQYSIGLYVFMDIDDMRVIFDHEDDYYNILISNEKLDIESGRIYSITTKDDILKISEGLRDSLSSITYMMIGASILVYIVVIFLMIKLMIDRASLNISLIKIFGFHKNEIRKLYIDGNLLTIIISAIVSIPLAKVLVDNTWFPMMAADIRCGFDTTFSPLLYLLFYLAIFILYFVVTFLLRRKLNSVSMVEILKNRE